MWPVQMLFHFLCPFIWTRLLKSYSLQSWLRPGKKKNHFSTMTSMTSINSWAFWFLFLEKLRLSNYLVRELYIGMYLNKILLLEIQLLSQEHRLGIPFLTALFFSQNYAVLNFPIPPNCRAFLIFICVFLGCALVLWKPLNPSNPIFSTAAWINPPVLQKLDIPLEV